MACHQHQGASGSANTSYTGIYTMLKGKYDKSGSSGSFACNSWDNSLDGDYQLCWDCHNLNLISSDNGRFGEHRLHVDSEQTPCIECHDVHNPYDVGDPSLINFSYGSSSNTGVDFSPNGNNQSTMFNNISCSLSCHDNVNCGSMGHNSNYNRFIFVNINILNFFLQYILQIYNCLFIFFIVKQNKKMPFKVIF